MLLETLPGFTSNPCVEQKANFPLQEGTATYTRNLTGGAVGSQDPVKNFGCN